MLLGDAGELPRFFTTTRSCFGPDWLKLETGGSRASGRSWVWSKWVELPIRRHRFASGSMP